MLPWNRGAISDPGLYRSAIADLAGAGRRDRAETQRNVRAAGFTPKYGSWLNLVEGFFSKMARSLLRYKIGDAARRESFHGNAVLVDGSGHGRAARAAPEDVGVPPNEEAADIGAGRRTYSVATDGQTRGRIAGKVERAI